MAGNGYRRNQHKEGQGSEQDSLQAARRLRQADIPCPFNPKVTSRYHLPPSISIAFSHGQAPTSVMRCTERPELVLPRGASRLCLGNQSPGPGHSTPHRIPRNKPGNVLVNFSEITHHFISSSLSWFLELKDRHCFPCPSPLNPSPERPVPSGR